MPAKIIKLIVYRMNRQNVIYLKKIYAISLSDSVNSGIKPLTIRQYLSKIKCKFSLDGYSPPVLIDEI